MPTNFDNLLTDLIAYLANGTVQLTTITTAELVAVYNELTGKSIARFSSRAAGEKAVSRLLAAPKEVTLAEAKAEEAELATAEVAAEPVADLPERDESCPQCGGAASNQTAAGADGTVAGDERNYCHDCGAEYWRTTRKLYRAPRKSVSAGGNIAASWDRPEVRAARTERTGQLCVSWVVGDDEHRMYFGSVAKAFKGLGLPMGQHIKFRKELKAASIALGATFRQYKFTIMGGDQNA